MADAPLMPALPLRLRNTNTSSFLAHRHPPSSSIVASILAFHLGHDAVAAKHVRELVQEHTQLPSPSSQRSQQCASSVASTASVSTKNIDCYDNHDVWLILRDGAFLVRLLHATAPPPTPAQTLSQTSDARQNVEYFVNNLPRDLRTQPLPVLDVFVESSRAFSLVLDTIVDLHNYHIDHNQHKLAIPALSKSSASSYRPPPSRLSTSSPITITTAQHSPSLVSTSNPNNGKLLLSRHSLNPPTPSSSPALSNNNYSPSSSGTPALSSSISDISSRGVPSPASSPDLSPTPPYDHHVPSSVSSASSKKDINNNHNSNSNNTPVSLLFGRRPSPLVNFPALPLSPPASPFTPSSSHAPNPSLNRAKLVVTDKGRTLVTYLLAECIGKGQFGTVYRALNLNSGRVVAVKRINIQDQSEDEIMQLSHEVHVLKTMAQHPCIVQYEGLVKTDDHVHIILEYAENGSLLNTLKDFGNLPEGLVASYVVKILDGLHYLHSNQIVHCDLKAANILTTKNGNIKLSDFGVSLNMKALQNSDDNNNVAGSPYWMAPEVILLRGASPASDIWSLGCTIIELITGHPPYSHLVTLSAMFRIVEDSHPPLPDDISPLLSQFLLQCFRKNSEDRPSAKDLADHMWLAKYSSVFGKDLRPQDSLPVFPRLSLDMHRAESSDSSCNNRPASSTCSSMDEVSSLWTKEGHMSPSTTDTSRYSLSSAPGAGPGDCCCGSAPNPSQSPQERQQLQNHPHPHNHQCPSTLPNNKNNTSQVPLINLDYSSSNPPSSLALWPKHTSLPPLFSERDSDETQHSTSLQAHPPQPISSSSHPSPAPAPAVSSEKAAQDHPDQPHCFVKGHFNKHVDCKLCKLPVKRHAAMCPDCGLICHIRCSKDEMFNNIKCNNMSNRRFYSKLSSSSLSRPLASESGVEDIRRSQSHPQPQQSRPPRTRHSMDEHLRGFLPPLSPLPSLLHAPSIMSRRKQQQSHQQPKSPSSSATSFSMMPSRTMSFSIGSSHSLPHHRKHRRHLSAIEPTTTAASASNSKTALAAGSDEKIVVRTNSSSSTNNNKIAPSRRSRKTSLRTQISDQGDKFRNNVHWLMGLLPRRRDTLSKSNMIGNEEGEDGQDNGDDDEGDKEDQTLKKLSAIGGGIGGDIDTDEDDEPVFQPNLYHNNASSKVMITEEDGPTKSFSTLKPYSSASINDQKNDDDDDDDDDDVVKEEFQFHALSSPPSLHTVPSSIASKPSIPGKCLH